VPIHPLPQFEADVAADLKTYEALKPPKTIVVRFGALKLVGEYPYDGNAKPGCGSKLVVRTHRGTELAEMLTTTCGNSGCSKSVSRKEMLQYVENSGGRDYPFFTDGRVLRVATKEDLDRQSALEQSRHGLKVSARATVERLNLPMKIVDAEPILGGERLTFYYQSEERLDLRELHQELGTEHHARLDLKPVGARDEARLVADYERCGQYCCCKNFLKVLKPVSMRSAKVQKATLDPLKISGRCGRLMCCLRYEDQTYEELRKKLPHKKQRVGTPEGDGWVVDSQILTQLVLVQLEAEDKRVAIAVEDLTPPKGPPPPPLGAGPLPGPSARDARRPDGRPPRGPERGPQRSQDRPERDPDRAPPKPAPSAPAPPPPRQPEPDDLDDIPTDTGEDSGPPETGSPEQGEGPRRRRRRRRRRRGPEGGGSTGGGPGPASGGPPPSGP
jgi:cell fate regulator YaaT (PSP1 superfamily)